MCHGPFEAINNGAIAETRASINSCSISSLPAAHKLISCDAFGTAILVVAPRMFEDVFYNLEFGQAGNFCCNVGPIVGHLEPILLWQTKTAKLRSLGMRWGRLYHILLVDHSVD